jgi:predicted dehydrogenase
MSREWMRYASHHPERIRVAALVDVVPAAARRLQEEFRVEAPVYSDLRAALREVGADVVWDITVPESREAVVTAALEADLDVMAEKPMAPNWAAARRLVDTARRTGRRYMVMQNRRYNPSMRRLAGLVATGAVGCPGIVAADFFLGPHFGGFRDAMEQPLLLDMAFDQARLLLAGRPVAVHCLAFNPPGSWYRGRAAALATFEWEGGAYFSYRGSWAAEGAKTSWDAAWRVVGDRGTAIWDGQGEPWAEVVDQAGEPTFLRAAVRVEAPPAPEGAAGHAGCLDAMLDALDQGTPAETEASDNIWSMAMVFGAIESARTGRRVELPEGLDSTAAG